MNHNILPKDKHDFKSVEGLARLERSMIIPLLPELLEWLQDMNWPIAAEIVDLLSKYTSETIPHVKAVFSQSDTGWIYNILLYLINEWDTDLVSRLSSSLRELAHTVDIYEDTDLLSIEILWKHQLIALNEATALLARKRSHIENSLHTFTAEQKAMFLELENERQHILNTDVGQIVNYSKRNNKSLMQKYQYQNSFRRYEEIEATIRRISAFT
ncbi:DUF5071 domain-containing protein [Paenibacillus graminis]|uniref:DUF5071 domain-containing protein n=2 Tax=Paenibacillus graminis TaxID=189425 RepID=UPI002DBCDD91|nr:DUF5071 domain-containing protein [Paenibacillus graminis]MEC0168087.1 DUF5071 domain-containing protein [Paenibacillus graminis]